MVPLMSIFASVTWVPFPRVSLETEQLYSTSVSGVTLRFEILTSIENGLPSCAGGTASIPGLKTSGKMNTTVTKSTDIMSSSRRGPRQRDLGTGSCRDTDTGLTPPDFHILIRFRI